MSNDLTSFAQAVLEEEFPSEVLSLDETLEVINIAVALVDSRTSGTLQRVEGNSLIVWMGGIHPDLFVYGAQLMFKHHGVSFSFDEKSKVRMAAIEEKYLGSRAYQAQLYSEIDHYAWPQTFLDGSTFEERLEALAEEYESDESPADMLLGGMAVPEDLDYDQRFQLVNDCIADIIAMNERYGKTNILINERLDRFLGWLLTIDPELTLMAVRSLLISSKVEINPNNLKNWGAFRALYSDLVDNVFEY